MLTRGVFLFPDNAPVHKTRIAPAAIPARGFEHLCHPPYILYLAPSERHLLRSLKFHLRGRRRRF